MEKIHTRLKEAEIKKSAQQIQSEFDSIPISELTPCKCGCGGVLWETSYLFYTVPMLHPKNGFGDKRQKGIPVVTCKKCGKAHPDQLDPKDKSYISNLPEELK